MLELGGDHMMKSRFLWIVFCLVSILLTGCTEEGEVRTIGIEVAPETVSAIMIIEDFDLSMIQLRILKSDGTYEAIDLDENMLSSEDVLNLSIPGTHQIHVMHLEFETSFVITMKHNDLVTSLINIHQFALQHGYTLLSYDAWVSTIVGETSNIASIHIDDSGFLMIYHKDQTESNAGQVASAKTVFVLNASVNQLGELILHYSDQSFKNLGIVDGKDGVSILSVSIHTSGELIILLSDGSTINAGAIKSVTPLVKVIFRYDVQGYAYDIFWTEVGNEIAAPSHPIKENHIFMGWFLGDAKVSFPWLADDETTLEFVAKWEVQMFSYSITDQQVTITGISAKVYPIHLTIPESIDGYPVTKIGASAFENSPERPVSISSITFPDSITRIESKAFYNCWGLQQINFSPESKLLYIGSYAFSNNYLYQPLFLPDRLLHIDNYAFSNASITQVMFSPESRLSRISVGAFANNIDLTSFVIPEGTSRIETHVFDQAEMLTIYAYGSAPKTNWSVSYNVMNRPVIWNIKHHGLYGTLRYVVTDTNEVSIINLTDADQQVVEIPETIAGYPVRNIGDYAFVNKPMMQWLYLPDNLMTIGVGAFQQASGLRHANLSNDSQLETIGKNAFANNYALVSIYLTDRVTQIDGDAFLNCHSLSIFTERSSESEMWQPGWNPQGRPVHYDHPQVGHTDELFYVYSPSLSVIITGVRDGVTSLVIPPSIHERPVETIIPSAFRNTTIGNIGIPSSVKTIGANAFLFCGFLTIYTTHASLPSGWDASWNPGNRPVLWQMSSMGTSGDINYVRTKDLKVLVLGVRPDIEDVVIPDSIGGYPVTTLVQYAFAYSKSLKTIDFGHSLSTIETMAFYTSSLESINFPASVTSIGISAFLYNRKLKQVIFDEMSPITVIERGTFFGCDDLEEVVLPRGLVVIGQQAFYAALSLESIWIPKTVTTLGIAAFISSQKLNDVTFESGSSLQIIDEMVFQYCHSLQSITLPEGLKYIKQGAFQGTGLIQIHLPSSLEEIQGYAFANNPSLSEVSIEENSNLKTIGSYAFSNLPQLTSFIIPSSVTVMGIGAFEGSESCSIYARLPQRPLGWHEMWNVNNLPVTWNFTE